MSDTQRSLGDLQTLLADNTTKDITPQRLRDFLVSALGGYGGLYADESSPTPLSTSSTPVKLTGWTDVLLSSGTTPSAAGSTVTVAVAAKYQVNFHATIEGTASTTFTFQVYIGSVPVTGSLVLIDTDATKQSVSLASIVECAANDVLSIYVSASAGSTAVSLRAGQLAVKRLD